MNSARLRGAASWASWPRRRAKPEPRTTPGLPATPATCSALSGWATTTTPTWRRFPGRIAAAPIWAEFMKRAVKLPQYSDTQGLCPARRSHRGYASTKRPTCSPTPACPNSTTPPPSSMAPSPPTPATISNGDQRNLFQKIFGLGDKSTMPALPAGQPSNGRLASDRDGAATGDTGRRTEPEPSRGRRYGAEEEARILQQAIWRQG